MTVAPALAHVDSSTSDGSALLGDCSQGYGPRWTQPRIVLNTPVGLAS